MDREITDYFTYEELLKTEVFDRFQELSLDYLHYFHKYKETGVVDEDDKVETIRILIRMISSIFGLPLLMACDCYVKMLDMADYYEEDKANIDKEMLAALEEHKTETAKDISASSDPNSLEYMKNLLERAFKKEI